MRHIARLAAASLPMSVKVVLAVGTAVAVASGAATAGHGPRPFDGSWRALTLEARAGGLPAAAGNPAPTAPTTVRPEPAPPPVPVPVVPLPPPPSVPVVVDTVIAPATGPDGGCQAALSYLSANAAPGFVASCPHDAGGHEATTVCDGPPDCAAGTMFIWIADPCPAAYMNEASNSWVLIGRSDAPWDPYGYCGESGNPFG
ncbi:MAG: hypothetical protein KGJ77_08275 [Acidobacteriota bacterium]|nr:hypothetical protein [Acidobacteriota bacterium]